MTDLLKILDMTEEKLKDCLPQWLSHYGFQNEATLLFMGKVSLADLAFRLKDEAKDDFVFGLIEVFQYITERSKFEIPSPAEMIKESQPIHWIIAALKGKELAKEKRRPL